MSRRRTLPLHHRPRGPLRRWTMQRASGVGVVAGIAAILLAGLFNTYGSLRYPYAGLLAVAAFCGASVLWITATDMRSRGTSGRMRPIRAFDAALGLALLLPSLYALSQVWPLLAL